MIRIIITHNMIFYLLEIAGSQGHDEVPQADQGAVGLRKEAQDHVVIVDHSGHLLPDDSE